MEGSSFGMCSCRSLVLRDGDSWMDKDRMVHTQGLCASEGAVGRLICACGRHKLSHSTRLYWDSVTLHGPEICGEKTEVKVDPNKQAWDRSLKAADDAFRFLAGLQLQDQPAAVQKEYLRVTRALGAVLRPEEVREVRDFAGEIMDRWDNWYYKTVKGVKADR